MIVRFIWRTGALDVFAHLPFKFCRPFSALVIALGILSPQRQASAQDNSPVSMRVPCSVAPWETITFDIKREVEKSSNNRLLGPFFPNQCGIRVAPVYYGEVFSNTKGGISTNGATQYAALLDLTVELDFEKLGLAVPGRFVLLGQNTHGRGLSEDFILSLIHI